MMMAWGSKIRPFGLLPWASCPGLARGDACDPSLLHVHDMCFLKFPLN